jgi:hypothetical protein
MSDAHDDLEWEDDEPAEEGTVWSILDSISKLAMSVTVLIMAVNASQLRATVDRLEAKMAKLEADAKPAKSIPAELITEPDGPRVRVDGRLVSWPEGMTVEKYLDALEPSKGRGETQ